MISIAAFVLGASTLVFLYNMIVSWHHGPLAPANPWRALTLEWQVSSPPPIFNFDETPQVVGGPYEYGVPGARHAIVTVHSPEPEVPAPAVTTLTRATPAQREALMTTMKHILVIANQTVGGDAVIAAVRRHADGEPVRVTVLCPRAIQRRLGGRRGGGPRLVPRPPRSDPGGAAAAGIEANGEVVASDPYEAVLDQLELDPPTEIIISTLPRTRSGWLRRDLIERVREGTKLPVEHVVVNPDALGDGSVVSAHAASAGHHEASASHSGSAYHESLLRSPVFLGMVMFIGSEIMLFASFFTAFFFVRFTHTHYPFGDFEIPTDSTAINTAILISSSFTMHWALVSIRYNRRFGLVVGLGLTLFLGLTFLAPADARVPRARVRAVGRRVPLDASSR